MVVTVAGQICCVMTISAVFTETYRSTHHRLVPWIWTSIGLMFAATGVLSIHRLRKSLPVLLLCCAALFAAVEIEKGMGTIIPGFIPEPWGKIHEYASTWVDWIVPDH